MEKDRSVKKIERIRILMHKVFNAPEGKEVLDMLVNEYVLGMQIGADANGTYFELGKAEMVKMLKRIADEDPKELTVSYDYNGGE